MTTFDERLDEIFSKPEAVKKMQSYTADGKPAGEVYVVNPALKAAITKAVLELVIGEDNVKFDNAHWQEMDYPDNLNHLRAHQRESVGEPSQD